MGEKGIEPLAVDRLPARLRPAALKGVAESVVGDFLVFELPPNLFENAVVGVQSHVVVPDPLVFVQRDVVHDWLAVSCVAQTEHPVCGLVKRSPLGPR